MLTRAVLNNNLRNYCAAALIVAVIIFVLCTPTGCKHNNVSVTSKFKSRRRAAVEQPTQSTSVFIYSL